MADFNATTSVLVIAIENSTAMVDNMDIDDICKELEASGVDNSTLCQKNSPGVSVASPVSMFVTGVVGNILALTVLYSTRKEVRKTTFFTLLLGLAWSDLFSQLMTSPVIISVYANDLKWRGGKPVCIYNAFTMIGFGMILPLLVCSLSIERLLGLRFTYFYSRVVTVSKAKYTFCGCWIFVLLFSSLPLVGFGSYEYQYPGTWCFLNFHNESPSDTAYAFTFAIVNVTVIVIIVICNVSVVLVLLKMRRTRHHNSSPSLDRRSEHSKKSLLQMEMETQMVWFLCAVTVVFVTCWLPLNVHIMINLSTDVRNKSADLLVVRLASINQILDPWLYILLRKSVLVKIANFVKRILCHLRTKKEKTLAVSAVEAGLAADNLRNGDLNVKTDLIMNNRVFKFDRELSFSGNDVPMIEIQSEHTNNGHAHQNGSMVTAPSFDSESGSSDSDILLDSNSSRCFPMRYDSERKRPSSVFLSFSRRRESSEDSGPKMILQRLLSLPSNIKT